MINFAEIVLKSAEDSNNAYVGLLLEEQNICLKLPIGCKELISEAENLEEDRRYEFIRNLYFTLYRAIRAYANIGESTRGKMLQDIRGSKAGQYGSRTISSQIDREKAPTPIFSHLDRLWSIMSIYSEKNGLQSFVEKLSVRNEIDLKNFGRIVKDAMYQEDGTLYIEKVAGKKGNVCAVPSDIVRMCCYVLSEVLPYLQISIPDHILALSNEYIENYLPPKAGVFIFDSWKVTRESLCHSLDDIYKAAVYKGDDFMMFYDALDEFINGSATRPEDQKIWGMSGFAHIWEAVCANYIDDSQGKIIFADMTNLNPSLRMAVQIKKEYDQLMAALAPMKPDIIWRNKSGQLEITDAKYKTDLSTDDYVKQLVYKIIVEKHASGMYSVLRNEFMIPYHKDEELVVEIDITTRAASAYMDGLSSDKSKFINDFSIYCQEIDRNSHGYTMCFHKVKFYIIRRNVLDMLKLYANNNLKV